MENGSRLEEVPEATTQSSMWFGVRRPSKEPRPCERGQTVAGEEVDESFRSLTGRPGGDRPFLRGNFPGSGVEERMRL